MPRSLESSGELRVRLGDSALAPMCDPEREMGTPRCRLEGRVLGSQRREGQPFLDF